jgi:hypothetical protein
MKITDALRDRTALASLLDPEHPRYVTARQIDRKRARDEWHRHRFVAEVMRANLEEIPRADLEFLRFGTVEDIRTGDLYRLRRDGLVDLEYTNAVAYYVGADSVPVLLERPPGPQTRAELEQTAGGTRAAAEHKAPPARVDEPVSGRRDKLWYLRNDRGGEVAELDIQLDRIDIEIDGLRALRYEETKAKLERLGFDTSKYRPPPRRLVSEQRCINHVRPDDDVEAIVIAGKERESGSTLDRLYADHVLNCR